MIDSMPENLDAPWEPRTFKVGDRVRIRLSGECRGRFRRIATGEKIQHRRCSDGCVGRVVDVQRHHDHPYKIRIDPPIYDPDRGTYYNGGPFAAIELEPMEATR